MRFLTTAEVTTQGLREVLANVKGVDAIRHDMFPLDPSRVINTARALNIRCREIGLPSAAWIDDGNAARHIADLANRLADHFEKAAA